MPFDSLASVMAYYGDKTAAHAVHAASQQRYPVGKSKLQVVNDVLVKHPHVYRIYRMQVDLSGDSIQFYLTKPNRKVNEFVLGEQHYIKMHIDLQPKSGVIESSDGGVGHAIGMCNGWIFDSNLSHALALTRKNLDWCSSSTDSHASFVKFYWAYVVLKKQKGKYYTCA